MSGHLPAWIERLLGEQPGAGEGTVWTLEHSWPWPPWVTLLFVVFAAVFVVLMYLRENRQASWLVRGVLAAIRLALIAIVLVMIAQVALAPQRTGLPFVAVVVDVSGSMSTVDRYDAKLAGQLARRVNDTSPNRDKLSRWNLVKTLLTEEHGALLRKLERDYKLRVYFLEKSSSGVQAGSTAGVDALIEQIASIERPEVEDTRLGAAIGSVLEDLRGTPPAAIVLISDGINTDGPTLDKAAERARRKGVPLYAVAVGSDEPARNLKLGNLLVDRLVFVDDAVIFKLTISGTGFDAEQVKVVLRQEGNSDALAEADVELGSGGKPQPVRLIHRPREVGQFRYLVEVEPRQGELQTDDNRLEATIEVRKEKIRVLLVQAYPNYEFRYLRNMLARDETIELNTVLQEADLQHAQQDAAALAGFPVSRDELFAYDVIVLGDANPALLSDTMMRNLVEFVDQPGKGGALVLIAGEMYMPAAYRNTLLEPLLPLDPGAVRYPDPDQVITDGYQLAPSDLGLACPALQLGDSRAETRKVWENLPPLYWLLEVPEAKPAVRTLAVDPTRLGHDGKPLPVIMLQYVGAGKVLFHATDETWRWRRRVGDVFFARYWIQMIRYLSRSKLGAQGRQATLTTDRDEYLQGEPVRLRVRFADQRTAPAEDDGVTVVLEHDGHRTERITLRRTGTARGTFEAVLSRPPAGEYDAWIAIPAMLSRRPGGDDDASTAKAREQDRVPVKHFSVKAPKSESERIRTDTAALRRAAKTTRGRFYTFQTAKRLLDDLPPGLQVPIETLPPKPLWNKWPLLLLFLLLLLTEWVLRKSGGMV